MSIIRKISVGSNYKDAMHYVVGQDVFRGKSKIYLIKKNTDSLQYEIWVKQEDKTILFWKAFNFNMPISLENDLNF